MTNYLMKKILFLAFSFIGLFVYLFIGLLNPVHADSNFFTDYDITYNVFQNGVTHATINGTLTNLTSRTYATQYGIVLGFDDITQVGASDEKGSITPQVQKTADGYNINLKFNDQVVGLNKQLHFTISFDTSEIAQQAGNIWEVNIPGLANQIDFHSFQVTVKVPQSFGPAAFIKPAQADNSLVFTKDQLGTSGISITFGTQQIYTLNLTYHLKNTNVFPIKTELALPPTTNYQNVSISQINPAPQNVLIDKDGNWLAQYYLLPRQSLDVKVQGNAVLSLQPKSETLSDSQRKLYLQEQPYWQTTNPAIIQEAKQLHTPEAIYDFVVKTLTYDYKRVSNDEPRVGAVGVLENPKSAVCLEFTDLFVTLARAAGIPAREIDGYGYTQNSKERPVSVGKDILHAWPEYYDDTQKAWIMIDPTWGNTTNGVDYFHVLDFDHIAFVVKGVESDYPIPAGGYKSVSDENKQDVNVSFSQTEPDLTEQLAFSALVNKEYWAGLPIGANILVKNSGQVMTHEQTIFISSNSLTPSTQQLYLPPIPPYGSTEVNFAFQKVSFLTNKVYPFTIQLAGKSLDSEVTAVPIIINQVTILGGIGIVLFTIIIFITARKAGRLYLL